MQKKFLSANDYCADSTFAKLSGILLSYILLRKH